MVSTKSFTNLVCSLLALGLISACNAIQTLTGDETKVNFANYEHGPNLEHELLAFYRFEETAGFNSSDYFGVRNLTGPYDLSSGASVVGQVGNGNDCGIPFNGQTLKMLTFNHTVPSGGDSTFALWMRSDGSGTRNYLEFTDASATVTNFYLGQDSGGNLVLKYGTNNFTLSITPATSVWTHVAIVSEAGGANFRIYKDGIEVQNLAGTSAAVDYTRLYLCNAPNQGGLSMLGLIDSVGIWARGLSDNEIYDLYNGYNHLD
ncbi:MAG: LamG domain-containing protein [Bacteriovoracaceae bacterium]|nr:LamG domain-containing protein [Bacteriovoracaceae bacterium]